MIGLSTGKIIMMCRYHSIFHPIHDAIVLTRLLWPYPIPGGIPTRAVPGQWYHSWLCWLSERATSPPPSQVGSLPPPLPPPATSPLASPLPVVAIILLPLCYTERSRRAAGAAGPLLALSERAISPQVRSPPSPPPLVTIVLLPPRGLERVVRGENPQ